MFAPVGERTQYAPGTFSWTDLATTDQDAAKSFYGSLFGWEAEDIPVGDGVTYSMMRLGGRNVAAISGQPAQQREAGVPPAWNNYITVESADATAQRAQELGANVHAPPFDVMDAGRMAVIRDPQGAFFMVWQPRGNIGAALVNEPGALTWNELASPDPEASGSFYRDLFGWEVAGIEAPTGPYWMIKNGDANNGGIRTLEPPGTPPHWLVYFAADDVDATLAKVEELGGSKVAGPFEIGMGKIAIVQDPQGAMFALVAGQLET
jgi:predicted enzyme related to lactoylglutathione lyase